MTDITFRSDMSVELVQSMGSDNMIGRAARVSTGTDGTSPNSDAGLIGYLMKNRHGSPFEHGAMTFRIEAPIFVFREFHRHRIGWSYNELSGRYSELKPEFYVPAESRRLTQTGKPGAYQFLPGSYLQQRALGATLRRNSSTSWSAYQRSLKEGIAREVARMVLPVNIYSAMYATCNPRSLMHFLSLRTTDPNAAHPSTPMEEIRRVAECMEWSFQGVFPLTWQAFHDNGRVAP